MKSTSRAGWLIPTGCIALSFIPEVGGALRVTQLTIGAEVTAENARFFAQPVPVLVHIFGASIYLLVGAFQFVPGLRARHPRWHRVAGRILVLCGLAAALSGMWMTIFYPLPTTDDTLLNGFRLVFGSAMAVSILLGLRAALRRDFTRHRAWMMRGYAIALAAGTTAVTGLPIILAVGQPTGVGKALHMAGAWLLNLAVAEWLIRRRPHPRSSVDAGTRLATN